MTKNLKMTLKTFTEEYTQILQNYSTDDLKGVLINMAKEVTPDKRGEFIRKISLQQPGHALITESSETVLNEIESLIEDIRAQCEEEPDWDEYYDDEDSLGEFSEFIPRLYGVFDAVEALFDFGNYPLARKAFDIIYTIFDIQDDYGRGISTHDLEKIDLDEIRAKYLRSIYLTEKSSTRVAHLLKTMTELSQLDSYFAQPKLEDLINISVTPLPEWAEFLQNWIASIKSEPELQYDGWYREAVYLLHGSSGLEEVAKTEGQQRPRVYTDWIHALIEKKDYEVALKAIKIALDKLPQDQPIRGAIGDLQVICGNQFNNVEIQLEGLWISFEAQPDLSKLVQLYQQANSLTRHKLMQNASESIRTYSKRMKDYAEGKQWPRDRIESPAHPDSSLLMHAYFFSHDYDNAFKLAQQGTPLGWSSSTNPQPLFVAFCLARTSNQPLNALPKSLKKFFSDVLNKSKGVWLYNDTHEDLLLNLEKIYAELLADASEISDEKLNWCLNTAEARVNGIVSKQRRGAYDRAALLTAACTETLKSIKSSEARIFFDRIKSRFPRHSSFQAELRQVMAFV